MKKEEHMPSRLMHLGFIMLLTLGAVLARPAVGLAQTNAFTTLDATSLGATSTTAIGINPQGDIVGHYTDGSSCLHGFLLSAGKYTTLDFPGANLTDARGINPNGDVVGFYSLLPVTSVCGPAQCPQCHGFLLSGGKYTTLDFPEVPSSTQALGINPQGDIVGRYTDTTSLHEQHGFLLRSGNYTTLDFPVPGATLTNALGINPQGEIVGFYSVKPVKSSPFARCVECLPFLRLSDGTYTTPDVSVAGTSPRILARGINPRGDIVGAYDDSQGNGVPFLLERSGNSSNLDVPGTDRDAFGINARGDIVGDYPDSLGIAHGYLLSGAP